MKRKLIALLPIVFVLGFAFTSCTPKEEDTCSSELGDIGPDYNCTVPVLPQICTVDGVDDHYVLDGVEYACPNKDCGTIPQALIDAILAKEGCGTKKSIDLKSVNLKLSKQAEVILANLKMESVLCNN